MKEFKHIIRDKNGLHARPAGMLVTLCKGFESDIRVRYLSKEADGKRLLSLMSLGALGGGELNFEISGEDEKRAYEAIKQHCEDGL